MTGKALIKLAPEKQSSCMVGGISEFPMNLKLESETIRARVSGLRLTFQEVLSRGECRVYRGRRTEEEVEGTGPGGAVGAEEDEEVEGLVREEEEELEEADEEEEVEAVVIVAEEEAEEKVIGAEEEEEEEEQTE